MCVVCELLGDRVRVAFIVAFRLYILFGGGMLRLMLLRDVFVMSCVMLYNVCVLFVLWCSVFVRVLVLCAFVLCVWCIV